MHNCPRTTFPEHARNLPLFPCSWSSKQSQKGVTLLNPQGWLSTTPKGLHTNPSDLLCRTPNPAFSVHARAVFEVDQLAQTKQAKHPNALGHVRNCHACQKHQSYATCILPPVSVGSDSVSWMGLAIGFFRELPPIEIQPASNSLPPFPPYSGCRCARHKQEDQEGSWLNASGRPAFSLSASMDTGATLLGLTDASRSTQGEFRGSNAISLHIMPS